MVFKVFQGTKFEYTPENEQMDRIVEDLNRLYGRDATSFCYLLIGVEIGDREIDGLIIKPDKIIILEMKNYRGNILADFDPRKRWVVEAPDEEPYTVERDIQRQVLSQRFMVSQAVLEPLGIEEEDRIDTISPTIATFIVVRTGSNVRVVNLTNSMRLWLKVMTTEDVVKKVTLETSKAISISVDMADAVVSRLKAREARLPYWNHSVTITEPSRSELALHEISGDLLNQTIKNTSVTTVDGIDPPIARTILQNIESASFNLTALDEKLASSKRYDVAIGIRTAMALGLKQYLEKILRNRDNDDMSIRILVVEAIQTLECENPTEELLPFLKDTHRDVRLRAMKALTVHGEAEATPAVLPILEERDEVEVSYAISVLGSIGNARAVEPLIGLAGQLHRRYKDPTIKRHLLSQIVYSLGRMGDERSVDLLASLLDDEWIRVDAIEGLGAIGGRKAQDSLVSQLNTNPADRLVIIESLSKVGEAEVAKQIHPFLDSGSKYERLTIIRALGRLESPSSFDPLWDVLQRHTGNIDRRPELYEIAKILASLDKARAEKRLRPLLSSENRETLIGATFLSPLFVSEDSIDILFPLLGDENEETRGDASYALSQVGGEEVTRRLSALLKSHSEFEVESAIYGLGELRAESAFDGIAGHRWHESENVRIAVALSLAKFNRIAEATRFTIDMVDDESQDVRYFSLSALRELGRMAAHRLKNAGSEEPSSIRSLRTEIESGGKAVINSMAAELSSSDGMRHGLRSEIASLWERVLTEARTLKESSKPE